MKLVLFFVIFVASSFFADAAEFVAEDNAIIINIDKFFQECPDFKKTINEKCPGLTPDHYCLVCASKGCSKYLFPVDPEKYCQQVNDCAAENLATC